MIALKQYITCNRAKSKVADTIRLAKIRQQLDIDIVNTQQKLINKIDISNYYGQIKLQGFLKKENKK